VTWFEIGNKAEWVNKKGITMNGEIIAILEPGEVAEDVLDEKERTKLSTTNLGAAVIPETRRALIRVYDENGWVTYHTKRLGTLTKLIEMEHEQKVTINDLMKEIREIKDQLQEIKSCKYPMYPIKQYPIINLNSRKPMTETYNIRRRGEKDE
jgi:hypothetical protein